LLLAAGSMPPYTYEYELIHHRRLIDSCIAEVVGIDYFLHKYPNHKIIIALNRRPGAALGRLSTRVESILGARMYGRGYKNYPLLREKRFQEEVRKARQHKNVLVVMPPKNSQTSSGTLNIKKLHTTYRLGQRAGYEILKFIES
jgi:predicted patatin/cPLA2 family phospholipase